MLFRQVTGWLGWMPAVALATPIPHILLALDGRVEWATLTNPFGGNPKPKPATDAEIMAFLDARA